MNLPQVYMCSPTWTLLPPPSPFHPSGSSQCTSPKHPVSSFNFMAAVTIPSDSEALDNKMSLLPLFPLLFVIILALFSNKTPKWRKIVIILIWKLASSSPLHFEVIDLKNRFSSSLVAWGRWVTHSSLDSSLNIVSILWFKVRTVSSKWLIISA